MKTVWLILCLLIAAGGWLSADKIDLAKLQKKENERLKKLKKKNKAGKVLSVNNKNIKEIIKSTKGSYGFIEVKQKAYRGKAKSDSAGSESEGSGLKKSRGYWEGLKKDLIDEISNLSKVIKTDTIQMNRNRQKIMSTTMLSLKMSYEKDFHRLRMKIAEDKIKLKSLKKELAGLGDKARKAGVPPGWVS